MAQDKYVDGQSVIRKGWLIDGTGGTEFLTYREWADEHIQDSEVAYSIAQDMLSTGDPYESFDLMEKVFETHTIVNTALFQAQCVDYEGER